MADTDEREWPPHLDALVVAQSVTACSSKTMPCECWRLPSSPASARTFIITADRASWLC